MGVEKKKEVQEGIIQGEKGSHQIEETVRERKIRLKKKIKHHRNQINQEKINNFYKDKDMNMSHIKLRKGVNGIVEDKDSKGMSIYGIIVKNPM